MEFWNLRDQDYLSINPSHIVFTYKIIDNNNNIIKSNKINRSITLKETINTINFKGYNLPTTMDYLKWGHIISESNDFAIVKKYNSNSIYHININILEKEGGAINVTLKKGGYRFLITDCQ